MTRLRGVHKDRAGPVPCLLDADHEVDTVSAGIGLVVVLADFEVAEFGDGGGLFPHAHGVEVEDLALVALLPLAAMVKIRSGTGTSVVQLKP